MPGIHLRPAELERDFGLLAELFTLEQDEPTTESGLIEDYEVHKDRIFCLTVAEDESGEFLGFNWATLNRDSARKAYFYVIVQPEHRLKGVGSRLYQDVEQSARAAGVDQLEVGIRDDRPEYRAFAERRGFSEHLHRIGMRLNLDAFDEHPYDELIARLEDGGFLFTSMSELGDTNEARRRLYRLNDTTAAQTMGADGEHPWSDFEDFQKHVCQAEWYQPGGQKVAIDVASGEWAAMSAITCFAGRDYAYNLFTGVDERYRGRKLGQAVKVTALRYAREVLGVHEVRTHHNTNNLPMLAIDRKFGYEVLPGEFVMIRSLI